MVTRSVSALLTDIWHCSTLRSMEAKHRKRGSTDLQTNRCILDRLNTTFILSVATVHEWGTKKTWDVPSWTACIWLSHCSARIPVGSAGRTSVRRGSRSMQTGKNSPPSGPTFTTQTERRVSGMDDRERMIIALNLGENTLIIWLEQWKSIIRKQHWWIERGKWSPSLEGPKGPDPKGINGVVKRTRYYREHSLLIVIHAIFISDAWETSQRTVCNVKYILLTPFTVGSIQNSSPMRDRAWIAFAKAEMNLFTVKYRTVHTIIQLHIVHFYTSCFW